MEDLNIVKSFYMLSSVCVRVIGGMSVWFGINVRVHEGYAGSP